MHKPVVVQKPQPCKMVPAASGKETQVSEQSEEEKVGQSTKVKLRGEPVPYAALMEGRAVFVCNVTVAVVERETVGVGQVT